MSTRDGSDHPIAFVGGRVCDDITALGRAPLPGAVVQVERHLLCDEGVQVDVVEAVPTTARGGGGAQVCGRSRCSRAHAYTRHGTTQT